MHAKSEAAIAARRILSSAWNGAVPVDPARIARDFGIQVLDAHMDRDMSGALVKNQGEDPHILLNATDSPNRKRFTCAHELGHFVRRKDQPEVYEYVDLRNSLAAKGSNLEEIFANEFAACLLMPEEILRDLHKQGLRELELSLRFGVSREAMLFRLKNLELEP